MLIGYARVSTTDQETLLQRDALKRAGVRTVYEEKVSAVSTRPQLQAALARMKKGDVLVVWKLDRLARSLHDLLTLMQRITAAGCGLKSLTEPIDTSSSIGEFLVQVLGAVAQLERAMIRERTLAGQAAAYRRGARFGRPKAVTAAQERQMLASVHGGESQSSVARRYHVSLIVVRRIVAESKGQKNTGKLPVLGRYLH